MEEQKTESNQTPIESAKPAQGGSGGEPKKEDTKPEVKEVHYHHHYEKKRNWDLGRFFWALILLFAGVAFLGNNFGWFSVNMDNIWRFWPVILIIIALSMLTRRGIMGTIFGGIVVVLIVAGIVLSIIFGGGSQSKEVTTQNFNETLTEDITSGKVVVNAGAGVINIGELSLDLVSGKLVSNITSLKVSSSVSDNIKTVDLSLDAGNKWFSWFARNRNELTVDLTDKIPLEVVLNVGAMDLNLDFSKIMLEKLEIKSGATSANLKFGNLVDRAAFSLDTGASSNNILLPLGVGARIKIDSGVSSHDLKDFKKTDDNTYETEGYDQAAKKIDLEIKMGASSLNVKWY
ncbi:MAG: DUF5668 domain-containing protein [Patescibacteria group bacterium]